MRAEAAFKLQNTELRTELELRQKLADVAAKQKNQAGVEALMRAEAALKLQNTELRTELELRQQLANVTERQKQQVMVEAIMRAEAAQRRQNAALQAELDLRTKLEKARFASSAQGQALQKQIDDQNRLNAQYITQKELQDQLAAAQARRANQADPFYRIQEEQLKSLTRAEMEKLAVDKLIDDMTRRRAEARAYLSNEYQAELVSTNRLSQAELVAAETAKQLEIAKLRLAKATAMLDPELKKIIEEYKKLEAEQRKATAAGSKWQAHLTGLSQMTASFRAAMAGVGMGFGIYTSATILAATATYGFVRAFKDIISVGAEFTKGLSIVNAAMDLNNEQYKTLEQAAIDLSATSRYSASQVVEAFKEMGMSGFEYQEAMEGVSSVLMLASIGMIDFGRASDIATNVLYGFNLEASDLTKVVDVMAQAVTDSAQNIEQLGTTMSYVAPVASSFGLSLEAVTAATEVLVNSGIKSSRAGTGLRRVFMALFSDSENVSKQLGELGVTVNTLAGDMDAELIRVLKAINVATNGATTGMGNLNKAVGIYGIPSFLALIKAAGDGTNSIEELINKLKGVEGAAYEMKKRIEDNLAIDFEKLQASISAVEEKLFMLFGDSLRNMVQDLTAFIRGLSGNTDAIKKFKDEVVGLLKIFAWWAGAALFAGILQGVWKLVAGWKAVGSATEIATKAMAMFNVVSTASIPGMVVKLIGLVAAGFGVYEVFDSLNEVIPQVAEETLALSKAQEVLNQSMGGVPISEASEGWAVRAKELKQSEIELTRQLTLVQAEIAATKTAQSEQWNSGTQLADGYKKKLDELIAKEKTLSESVKKTSTAFKSAMADLIRSEIRSLENQEIEVAVKIEVSKSRIASLESVLSAARSDIRKAVEVSNPEIGKMFDQEKFIAELKKVNPVLAAQYVELQKLKKGLEELEEKQKGLAETTPIIRARLEQQAKALTEAATATDNLKESLDNLELSEEGKRTLDKITEFVSKWEAAIRGVAEANRIEALSTEDKIAYYSAIVQKQQDNVTTLKQLGEEMARIDTQVKYLEGQQAKGLLDKQAGQQLEALKALREGYTKFQTEVVAGEPAALKALEELGSLVETNTKDVEELTQKLWELFNLPSQSDFPDTLKGQLDFAIAQADALLSKYSQILGAGLSKSSSLPIFSTEVGTISTARLDALKDEMAIVKALEKEYGLLEGQLQVTWQAESSHGTGRKWLEYDEMQGDVLTRIRGPFQIGPGVYDRAVSKGADMTKFSGHALAAALEYADAKKRGRSIEDQFKQYYGGSDESYWKDKTENYAASRMKELKALNPELKVATAEEQKLIDTTKELSDAEKENAAVTNAATSSVRNAVATDQDRAKALTQQADAVLGMAKTNELLAKSIDEQTALEQQDFTDAQVRTLLEKEEALLQARIKNRQELEQIRGSASELSAEGIAQAEKLIALDKEYAEGIEITRAARVAAWEERVKQGDIESKLYTRSIKELKQLGEGYDSAWSRSRKYYKTMRDIYDLEKAGYLTHTEAYLEKINAHLESMDPLTKQFSEEIVNTFKNIWSGSEDASEAVDNLKKSLKDLTMEKFVVNLGVSMTGKIMEPFMKMFQHTMTSYLDIGANIFTSIGSMLLNSIGGLFGGSTTGAGAGIGGVGGLSDLFSVGGLTNMFGGYTMGSGIADLFLGPGGAQAAVMDMGTTGSSFFSNSMGNLATTPNWNLSLSGIAGSLVGNLLFGNKGYGGIGSSIGGTAGSMIGAALLTPVLGPFAPLVGSLLGGVGGGFLGSLFGDEEPKYGHYMADTGGRIGNLEDWENGPENYSKGAFGLTFGISDKGSKNFDASEMKNTFDALAAFSEELASFFGEEVSKQIEDALADWPQLWGGDDINSAFKDIFGNIIDAAGQTSDEMAQLFDVLVGTLTGTAEEAAAQIKKAMAATEGMIVTMGQMMNKEVVNALGFKGELVTMAKDMAKYAVKFAESGETQTDAIIRVTSELAMLQNVIDQTATSIEGLNGDEIADLAHSIAEAFGSIEKALSYQAIYYEQFKSASEKATDAIKVVINKLNTELPDIRKELEKFYIEPDKLKPIIPELKEEKSAKTGLEELIKDFEKQGLSSGYAYAANYLREGGSFTVYDGYVGPSQEEMDAMADLLKEVTDKPIAHTFTIDYGSAEAYTDPANYEFQAKYPWNDTDLDKNNKENEAIRKANAESILKAVEFYAKGVASGRIEKSADTEKQLQDMMNQYADTISAMGIDVTKGLDGVAQQIKDLGKTYLTTEEEKQLQAWDPNNPDAKNAQIYAQLIEAIPTSRQEFNDLIGQIDTATEAGRLFHAEIMKLVEAFDAMYDSIENFERWLGVTDDEELATKRLTKIFEDMGMTLPDSKDALLKMYEAGKFTAEQLAILGASVEDLETLFGAADEVQESYDDLSNATIRELEASLSKFTDELNKSKAALEATKSAIESLRKASQTTETYMDEIRNRARAALTEQRLPDDIQEIVRGLGEVNKEDYGTSEDYMAAVYENENLLRQIQLRAQNQVNYDQKQVDLIQEQINVAKEALIAEKDNTQKLIASYQEQILELEGKLQTMWDTGLGQVVEYLATISIWIGDIKNLLTAAEGFFVNLNLQIQTHQITANSLLAQINTNSLNQLGWLQSIRNAMGSAAAVATPAYTPEAEPPELYTPTGTQERADQTRDLQLDELLWELRQLHADMKYQLSSVDTASRRTADTLTRWEGDGLPPDREEYLRQTAYNTRQRIASSPCM